MNKLPFVWELNNNGVISHAIGTLHYCPVDFTEQIKTLIDGKSTAMTEAGTQNYSEARKIISQISAAPYLAELSYKHQQKISRMLAPITFEMLRKLPLFNIYGLVQQKSAPDTQMASGIDETIKNLAQKAQVTIHPIETSDEGLAQGKYMVTRFGENLGEWLNWEDEQFSQGKKTAILFSEGYLSGDEKRLLATPVTLGQTLEQYLKKNPEMGMGRHKHMAENTMPYLTSPTIIGIGVAHLIAETTVLDFYQNKGIKIERIK